MTRGQEISAKRRFLTALYSEEVFQGRTVRQERPHCCGKDINLLDNKVIFRELTVGSRRFHLLEPVCPLCGKRVEAVYHLMI